MILLSVQALGIEDRLIEPRTPRTKAMVERCHGWIADVLKSLRVIGTQDMAQTRTRYVALYNEQLP